MPAQHDGILNGNGTGPRENGASVENGSPRRGPTWTLEMETPSLMASSLPTKGMLRSLKNLAGVLWPHTNHGAGGPSSERRLRPTAYLDGLRGFAAFLVYIHHHELWAHATETHNENAIFENAWGWAGEYRFATLPVVRHFFTGGHFAVATFFVISGYVLSIKSLALIQAGEHLKLGDTLASAFFRRWFRLWLPIAVVTFVYVTSWHVFGIWNTACEPKETYGEELWRWYSELKGLSFLFKEVIPWLSYNTHLWSIPIEMRGSIIIFVALLALSRATTKARLLCQLVLIFYFMYIADGAYYGALFISGMLQADLDLLASRPEPNSEFPRFLRRLEPYKTLVFYHLFAVAMWLGGVPSQTDKIEELRKNPGWYWLSFLKPQAIFDPKWFFLIIASNCLVASIPRIRWLKRFFESRFCQFLGRVSYSFYLVHGPVLALLGDRLYNAVGYVRNYPKSLEVMDIYINKLALPKLGPMGMEIAFLMPHLIVFPVTLWVADFVTRTVDEPSVRFAAWLYKQIQGGPVEPKPEDAMRLA